MTLVTVNKASAKNNVIAADNGSMIKAYANQYSLCDASSLTDLLLVVKLIILLYLWTQVFPFQKTFTSVFAFTCPLQQSSHNKDCITNAFFPIRNPRPIEMNEFPTLLIRWVAEKEKDYQSSADTFCASKTPQKGSIFQRGIREARVLGYPWHWSSYWAAFVGKQESSFHLLESCFCSVSWSVLLLCTFISLHFFLREKQRQFKKSKLR